MYVYNSLSQRLHIENCETKLSKEQKARKVLKQHDQDSYQVITSNFQDIVSIVPRIGIYFCHLDLNFDKGSPFLRSVAIVQFRSLSFFSSGGWSTLHSQLIFKSAPQILTAPRLICHSLPFRPSNLSILLLYICLDDFLTP